MARGSGIGGAWRGPSGQAWHGSVGPGASGPGLARRVMGWQGRVWFGLAGRGLARRGRQGVAGYGMAWNGKVRQAWRVKVGLGQARRGAARRGWQRSAGLGRHGWAGHGVKRLGMARLGRRGETSNRKRIINEQDDKKHDRSQVLILRGEPQFAKAEASREEPRR
jgi:hypothetical protein